MTFSLGSDTLQDPNGFSHPSLIIGETDYACDGTMKTDVIAVKTRFILSWRYLTATEFLVLDTHYRAVIPVDFGYPDDSGVQQSISVRILELQQGERILPTLYQGVSISMREV